MALTGREELTALTYIEEAGVADLDPSLSGGYKVIYEKECPFELRMMATSEGPQQVLPSSEYNAALR